MKYALYILIVLLLGALAYVVLTLYTPPDTPPSVETTAVSKESPEEYFISQMTQLGSNDVGHLREGLSAELLISAFPGLIETDFDGVATLDGHYAMDDEGLILVPNTEFDTEPGVVTDDGYHTLLQNVATRLSINVESLDGVASVIASINTLDRIKIGIGEKVNAFGITMIVDDLVEDTRCPINDSCSDSGTVRIQTTITNDESTVSTSPILTLGETIIVEGITITFGQVAPALQRGLTSTPQSYRFYFQFAR